MRESVAPDLRIKHLERQVRLLSFLWLAVRIGRVYDHHTVAHPFRQRR
jgi:hypothetical protein